MVSPTIWEFIFLRMPPPTKPNSVSSLSFSKQTATTSLSDFLHRASHPWSETYQ
jgi:hypothetical protein